MRVAILLALIGCGSDLPDYCENDQLGPIEAECVNAAERYCCGVDNKYRPLEFFDCVAMARRAACQRIGGDGGCTNEGNSCVRSTVDFDACNAALDARGGCVEEPTGLPAECVSDECAMPGGDCVEQVEPPVTSVCPQRAEF